jgi:putative ABC transport system ATP-binding protein
MGMENQAVHRAVRQAVGLAVGQPARQAIQLRAVSRTYGAGDAVVTALDDVTLGFPTGSFTAVMGPSGSGKSTLLQCAAGLDRPTSGSVRLGDTELTGMSETRLTLLRRRRIGFVFQAFNLLPALTAEQNVALPLRLSGRRPAKGAVREALARVGLADRAGHRPAELSGGQQQRVALARALITGPEVLFGDEPTGALDSEAGRQVLTMLRGIVDDDGRTVVMVTHDPVAASYADRVLFLADGRLHGELASPTAESVATRMAATAMPVTAEAATAIAATTVTAATPLDSAAVTTESRTRPGAATC